VSIVSSVFFSWLVCWTYIQATQEDSLIEDGHSMNIYTNGGASTYCTGYCLMDSSITDGSTYMSETFEPAAGMNSVDEFLNPVLGERSNWGEICDLGLSLRRAELMPSFAIV